MALDDNIDYSIGNIYEKNKAKQDAMANMTGRTNESKWTPFKDIRESREKKSNQTSDDISYLHTFGPDSADYDPEEYQRRAARVPGWGESSNNQKWTPFQNIQDNLEQGKGLFGREGGMGSGLFKNMFKKDIEDEKVLDKVKQVHTNSLDETASSWFRRKQKDKIQANAQEKLKEKTSTPTTLGEGGLQEAANQMNNQSTEGGLLGQSVSAEGNTVLPANPPLDARGLQGAADDAYGPPGVSPEINVNTGERSSPMARTIEQLMNNPFQYEYF